MDKERPPAESFAWRPFLGAIGQCRNGTETRDKSPITGVDGLQVPEFADGRSQRLATLPLPHPGRWRPSLARSRPKRSRISVTASVSPAGRSQTEGLQGPETLPLEFAVEPGPFSASELTGERSASSRPPTRFAGRW